MAAGPTEGYRRLGREASSLQIAFIAQPIDSLRPPVQGGSLALWIYQVARICARRGHRPFVFANHGAALGSTRTHHEGVEYVFTPTALNRVGNRIMKVASRMTSHRDDSARKPIPEFGAAWRDACYALHAARECRRHGCEVVHIMNYSQFAPIVRRVHPHARIFLHMECEWLTQLDHATVDRRLDSVDTVIGCSEYITRKIAEHYPRHASRCVTVPNAAPLTPYYDRARTEPNHVLFVGRVSPEKGVHDLVQAFHLVLRRFPLATLHVAGGIGSAPYEFLVGLSDEPFVADLKRYYDLKSGADIYGDRLRQEAGSELGRRIIFAGRVENTEVGEYYKRASILVNPSLSEAFGMSLVEAMMYRVPVVATRVGGMTNIVDHGRTGMLVEPANPEALAQAICELLEDRARAEAMGDAGRAVALDKYSWDGTTDLLIQTFSDAVRRA